MTEKKDKTIELNDEEIKILLYYRSLNRFGKWMYRMMVRFVRFTERFRNRKNKM